MDELKDISSEVIRQNWSHYKDLVLQTSPHYEILWDDLTNKFNIDKNDMSLIIFKKLIMKTQFWTKFT